MTILRCDAMMRQWSEPLPDFDSKAEAALRELYTDPVVVNGAEPTAPDLVARRARSAPCRGRPGLDVTQQGARGRCPEESPETVGRHAHAAR